MKDAQRLPMFDSSQIADSRRVVRTITDSLGFAETAAGKAAIIVTELATNLVKHAVNAELLLRRMLFHGIPGVEMIALDRGPGIANLAMAMRDGYSTAGGSGTGLGAIARLSDVFDIYSAVDAGTAVLSQVWASPLPSNVPELCMNVDVLCVAKPGEQIGGDGWGIHQSQDHALLMVADGLGHGPSAADASFEAIKTFNANVHLTPSEILYAAHAALHSTRGAAVAIAKVDCPRGQIAFAGVGNIVAAIASPDGSIRHMTSYDGTVGDAMRKVAEFSYPLPPGAIIIMHSDGLTARWVFDNYPGLPAKHPGLIAAVLYRDFARGRDDATVLVAKSSL